MHEFDVGRLADSRHLAYRSERIVKATDFVNEPRFARLVADHHAATAVSGIDCRLRDSRRLRDDSREAFIEVVHVFLQGALFLVRPRTREGFGIRMTVRLYRFGPEAHLLHKAAQIDLAAVNTDTTNDGVGFREDGVRTAGDVVGARSTHATDARHHGDSLFAHIPERMPNLVGGDGATAR